VQLTPTQLLSLMSGSLTYQQDRRSVQQTLTLLKQLGVTVVLKQPRKRGAAGEWIPHTRTIRIRPDIPALGSRAFARVLNHEVIHVAQSCKGGGLSGFPVTLGLGGQPSRESLRVLKRHPVYAKAPQRVRQVEIEAFANQDRLDLGPSLLSRHCGRS
jgi:hypothetical protein